MYATHGVQLVVMPGHSESKHWWHNIEGHLSEVQVLVRRHWIAGVGEVVRPDSSSYDAVRTAYIERWPSVDVPADQPFVVLSGCPAPREGTAVRLKLMHIFRRLPQVLESLTVVSSSSRWRHARLVCGTWKRLCFVSD